MRWRKVWVVASTEAQNAVRAKAFLVSVLVVPALIAGSIYVQAVLAKQVDRAPRHVALVDRTGVLGDGLIKAADRHNRETLGKDGKPTEPPFLLEMAQIPDAGNEESLLAMADRVRRGELYAFVEIPKGLVDPREDALDVLFYSDNPNDRVLPNWLEESINGEVRNRRLLAARMDPVEAARLSRPVPLESLTLPERISTKGGAGEGSSVIRAGRKVDRVRSMLIPGALVVIVYLVVMTTASPLIQSVLEEKMSRISEVLLGSLTPFELMLGKLCGGTAVAFLLASIYVTGGLILANRFGYSDSVPIHLLWVLALFAFLALFLFGSLYMALGAACSDLKDAQSLMTPLGIIAMLPILLWIIVAQAPSSPLSVTLSLIPFATPYLMLVRMAIQPPPVWQVALSIVLTTGTVLVCVWAAAKIFRTGLLMQGKAPSFAELARWVMAK